ncbi:MAG: hypothetical protein AMJ62_09190 [Myxococcales bacterium SG8_38]|nr:MAG: hypothetical protein AMJ62_09190 [Myxococcales bacterium SG8_38]
MRWIGLICFIMAAGSCSEDVYFIPGTGQLPDCTEAPILNLDGSLWYDNGTVTILSEGCEGASPGQDFESCGLDWAFTQEGNDVTIIVDSEYRIEGRLCGDQLYLRGGWWLPVVDEDLGSCTYDEDSAEEVGILQEGNVLTVRPDVPLAPGVEQTEDLMTGTLQVRGRCAGQYEVTFRRK